MPSSPQDKRRVRHKTVSAKPDATQWVERELIEATSFMRANGFLHFDAHFRNILTDGSRLYFADLGLATSRSFDLSSGEAEFAERHAYYDEAYTLMELVNWLVVNACGVPVPATGGPVERNEYIRRCANGFRPEGVPAGVAALITRHAPVAAVMNDFFWDLFDRKPSTPYPASAIASARTHP
jgi:hypothetical protein